jgi:hypothetical protein
MTTLAESPRGAGATAGAERSRIEAARARAATARRITAVTALAGFGVLVGFVRATHPAGAKHAVSLQAPAALVSEVTGTSLGGGSIGPSSGPSVAATGSS